MVDVPNQAIRSMMNSDEWVILESAPTVHNPVGYNSDQKKCLTCGVIMHLTAEFVKHWRDAHLESTIIKIRGQPDKVFKRKPGILADGWVVSGAFVCLCGYEQSSRTVYARHVQKCGAFAVTSAASTAASVAQELYDEVQAFMALQSSYPVNDLAQDTSYQKPAMLAAWEEMFQTMVSTEGNLGGQQQAKQYRQGLLELRYMAMLSNAVSGDEASGPYNSWKLDTPNDPPKYGDKSLVDNIAASVHSYYKKAEELMGSNNMAIRAAINAEDVDKPKYSNYFGALRKTETVQRYSHTIKAMLVFVCRALKRRPAHVDLSSFITPAVHAAFGTLVRREGKVTPDTLQALFTELFSQHSTEIRGSTITQIVPAMLAILSIDNYGEMTSYYDISHVAVHFIMYARLTCFYEVVTKIPEYRPEEHKAWLKRYIDALTCTTNIGSVFSSLVMVKSLAMSLDYHGVALPAVTYDSVSGDIIAVKQYKVSLSTFQTVVKQLAQTCQKELASILRAYSPYGQISADLCSGIVDDLTEREPDFSFISSKANNALDQSIRAAGRGFMHRFGITTKTRANIGMTKDEIIGWLKRTGELVLKLLTLCLFTGGLPSRGTELEAMLVKNKGSASRSLIWHADTVALVSYYNKSSANRSKPKVTIRYLPRFVSEMLVVYLVYIRSVEKMLAKKLNKIYNGCSEEFVQAYYDYIFVCYGDTIQTDQLSKSIKRAFTSVASDAPLTISLYRQFASALAESQTSFGRVFQGFVRASMDRLDEEDEDTMVDEQLGHTGAVGVANYARSNLDFGQMNQHKMRMYLDVSCQWHAMLGLDKWSLPGHFNPDIVEPCVQLEKSRQQTQQPAIPPVQRAAKPAAPQSAVTIHNQSNVFILASEASQPANGFMSDEQRIEAMQAVLPPLQPPSIDIQRQCFEAFSYLNRNAAERVVCERTLTAHQAAVLGSMLMNREHNHLAVMPTGSG
ncbi:hypothetical protein GGI05_002182, partial [Coemansia sp. RSA 2603]